MSFQNAVVSIQITFFLTEVFLTDVYLIHTINGIHKESMSITNVSWKKIE